MAYSDLSHLPVHLIYIPDRGDKGVCLRAIRSGVSQVIGWPRIRKNNIFAHVGGNSATGFLLAEAVKHHHISGMSTLSSKRSSVFSRFASSSLPNTMSNTRTGVPTVVFESSPYHLPSQNSSVIFELDTKQGSVSWSYFLGMLHYINDVHISNLTYSRK